MTTPRKNDTNHSLNTHLDYLRLSFVLQHYPECATRAAEQHHDHIAFLAQLIEGEVLRRQARSVERRMRLARFPVRKTLADFNWSWPRKVNRLQIQNLFRLQFIEDNVNVVFIGGVGLGKSHLAAALGLTACEHGYSVLFASAVDVVNTLAAARTAGTLKVELRKYLRPRLLILDEIGYLPIDKVGADLLFQIISQRYERGAIVITTNRVYKKWAEIFNNDATLTSAVLDRLLHHAETVTIEGQSYRMKDRINEPTEPTTAEAPTEKPVAETTE